MHHPIQGQSQCPGLVASHVITAAGSWHAQDTLDRIVPEGHQYRHLDEGLDDMPAHVKVGFFLQLCLHTMALNDPPMKG